MNTIPGFSKRRKDSPKKLNVTKKKNMAGDFNSRIHESEGKIVEIRINLFLNTDLKIIKEK